MKAGRMQSSQHLLALGGISKKEQLTEKEREKITSQLYIPSAQREFKKSKVIKMDIEKVRKDDEERKKVKFDLIEKEL